MGSLLRLAPLTLCAALSAAAAASDSVGEVRGRLVGDRVFPAVVYLATASGPATASAEPAN